MDSGSVVPVTKQDKNGRFREQRSARVMHLPEPRQPVGSLAGEYRLSESSGMKALSYNLTVLLGTETLAGCLGWDLLADKPVWRKQPPFLRENRPEIHDQDAAEFAFWASERLGADFKSSQALEAIEVYAKRHPFHPVQEYLSGLSWDKVPRLDNWLSDAFGCTQDAYHLAVGKSFLIGCIARAMSPGCQMDTMLVLMGDQGLGKTSAVRSLMPDFSWYAETTESPANKDFYQGLRGKWIVEIGELHSFRNADWTKIKQMLSAKVDTYRPSYGHFTKDYPRQCAFIGTTNDDTWNRDATGARRFWPVRCTETNLDFIRSQRDQLWAEALHRYRGRESWWDVRQGEEQKSVYEEDAWEVPIKAWVLKEGMRIFTPHEILTECLGFDISRYGLKEQNRVAQACRNLGFSHIRKRINGKPMWAWDPCGSPGG
ncbi:MAG: virulence-associated E family protein [Acidithiobacillus ferriphilus]